MRPSWTARSSSICVARSDGSEPTRTAATFCVSRHDLQQFVHYTLPRKYLAGVDEHIAVARALGDALEHLGAPAEYGELCRSPETLALLRLWDVDEDAAFAQFAAFTDASGLEPPDVDEFQWQGVMGMVEARTRDAATLALERASESGDTRPAAEIVRAVLAEPDPDGGHPTRLLAVQAERIDRWAGWHSSPRRALLEPLVSDLVDARSPEWPADDVLDWLLDEARAGLALTERGALSRALCVEVARRRPEWTWGKPPRSEADVGNLEGLHAALRGSGLVRRRGRKLLATKRAGAADAGCPPSPPAREPARRRLVPRRGRRADAGGRRAGRALTPARGWQRRSRPRAGAATAGRCPVTPCRAR